MRSSFKKTSATAVSALAMAGPVGAATAVPASAQAPLTATEELNAYSETSPEAAERVSTLRGSGLNDDQALQLLRDPLSAAETETTYETSPNVTIEPDAAPASVPVGGGFFAAPADQSSTAAAAATCGWAITNHDGSAFAQRSARLTLRTDWCWKSGRIQGTPVFSHRSSVTLYGQAGGWRVRPSYNGSIGWIGSRYQTEAKTDWRLLACAIPGVGGCIEVQHGTAWAQHNVSGVGTVRKAQGGWP